MLQVCRISDYDGYPGYTISGISVALWRRAGACLGRQLVREGEVLRGAEYLVSSGLVLEGVETLAKHGHYRAAAAVSRARLDPASDLARSVMRGWASQSHGDGE